MKVLLFITAALILCQVVSTQREGDTSTPSPCPVFDCASNPVNCFIDPCQFATCPVYPGATCCSNYCGGCNAFWITADGADVTAQCLFDDECPALTSDIVGSCAFACRGNTECSNSQICCSNGCGSSCVDPVDRCATVPCPFHLCIPGFSPVVPEGECCEVCRPTLSCPNITDSTVGTCQVECSDTMPCPDNKLCCSNGCGRVCMAPVVTCLRRDNGDILQVGDRFRPDDCTTCTCLRNGSIVCNETCIKQCPDASTIDAGLGTCANECSPTEECPEGQFCCANSCGATVCRSPTVFCRNEDGVMLSAGDTFDDDCNTCTCGDDGNIFCTEIFCPDTGCPAVSNGTIPDGFFCAFNQSCANSRNTECPDSQLCCQVYSGCAHACVDPVIICEGPGDTVFQVGESFMRENSCTKCTCEDNSQFNCIERDCPGCTDNATGKFYPVGTQFPSSDGCNTCSCSAGDMAPNAEPFISCTEIACPDNYCEGPGGVRIPVGETFDAPDGCNTCSCTANGIICTLVVCVDRCFLPPEVGDCDAVVPRFYYDHTTGICSRFTYGGCGGNRNRFETHEECLRACNRNSTCLQDIYPENQEPRCLIASQQKWTFNIDAGRCERIGYIPCQSREGFNVYDTEAECNRTCINGTTIGPECPPDVPLVFCFADPCRVNSCPNFPNTKCISNFCGGCNAWFFDVDGNNVTDRCRERPTCDDGSPIVLCFANPCEVNDCPNFPNATCEASFCGGCNAWFFEDGNNVTDRCHTIGSGLPTPLQDFQCPALASDAIGTCVEGCRGDDDCDGDFLCCSNGCGRTCQMGDSIPYYQIPLQCPEHSDLDFLGICVITNDSCTMDEDCDDDELCCRSGCGRVCTSATTPSAPCFAIADSIYSAIDLTGFVGVYIPQCLDDGTFAPIQCHGSTGYCWCVHTLTGEPISARAGRGERPRCTTCTYNNQTYYPGQSFASTDGCNKCFCSENGAVPCTRIACVDPTGCEADPEPGLCRGSFPRYYYDSEDGNCKQFIYGGCGGNDNRFLSIPDCLKRCDRDSVCLQDVEPGPCEALIRRYFFNRTSGRCEQFAYGGCQGNDNNFNTGEECLDACDPDGEYVQGCVGVVCDTPDCGPGSELVRDDSTCCPYCSEPVQVECRDDEWLCRDGTQCIPLDQVCDVLRDCDDGSDERDCPEPPVTCDPGFLCGTQECIPEDYVCDDYVDCRDRSDERGCISDPLPVNTNFISYIPRQCPSDRLAICQSTSCLSDEHCRGDQLCCPTSCGHSLCMDAEETSPRCPALRRFLLASLNTTLLGSFMPNCERDGTFSSVQCHERFCWCVDIQDGYPLSEGIIGLPACAGCQLNADDATSVIPFGETYPANDGCNVCYCTREWPEERCTNDRCPAPCQIDGVRLEHGGFYEDECIACKCDFGSLSCSRRPCFSTAPIRQPTRVTMPFKGDFDAITSDNKKIDELKREVTRTFLKMYGESLKLNQDQIDGVDLMKGSVIVIITLSDSDNITSANLTVLLNQLEQDYMTGQIIIRFDNQVLQPSGDITVQEQSATGGLLTWHIAIIVIAGVAILVAIVAVIIAVVVCCRSKSNDGPKYSGTANPANDYGKPVSYTKHDDTVKVPLDA